MDESVWFVVVPWLAFGAGLVGLYFWLRAPRPPRSARSHRRRPRGVPDQGEGGEHDADLGQTTTSS
ncbi:MAG TPA: hypothetical protein VLM11_10175 [Streptosporangiaceae bacterium]|nr:hypothetical protein [Streptosporangiaceae bacterium]